MATAPKVMVDETNSAPAPSLVEVDSAADEERLELPVCDDCTASDAFVAAAVDPAPAALAAVVPTATSKGLAVSVRVYVIPS